MASLLHGIQNLNLSLYTIPAAWLLSIAPQWYATRLYQQASSAKFDLKQPRSMTKIIADSQCLDSNTKARLFRARSAHQNGFENLGLFAAAVVAGNLAHLDNSWLNGLSVGYVISRMVYNLIYINNTTDALASTRTVVFVSGVSMIMTLFVMAANVMIATEVRARP